MIANDFVPLPLSTWSWLTALGAIPRWGTASKQGMRQLYSRTQLIFGPVQEVPNPASRVTLDTQVRDRFDIPVARVSGKVHPEDLNTARFISEKAVAWALASGAKTALPLALAVSEGPSGGQHQGGYLPYGQ